MDSQILILLHTAISLIAIFSGAVLIHGLFTAKRMSGTALVFLSTTGATSISGFLFHRDHVLPSHIVGAIALVVLVVTCFALYTYRLRGIWRAVYAAGIVVSLWFNVFVLVAQAFLKIAPLHELAPNGSEPPFAAAEGVVFLAFIALGVIGIRRFRPRDLQPVS
jgi:hypothetical protein